MARHRTGSLFRKSTVKDGKRIESARWYGAYTDPHAHKRITVRLYTDRAASRKELDRLIECAERKATGIIDRFAEHRVRPLKEHVAEYLDHCRHVGQARVHVGNKQTQLARLLAETGATRLPDLDPNVVERHLQALRKEGLSARSVNQHHTTAATFLGWCVTTGRAPDNPLRVLPKLDERADRRRVRRALTPVELATLVERSGSRGVVYLLAALAGLRRGELKRILWSDIDLKEGTVRVRIGVGKAKREDFVPLHRQVVEALAAIRPDSGSSVERVFATVPNHLTVQRDLKRAGIALVDAEGRRVDLHACRTTTGTMLARAGVAPQVARLVMRHADVRTTQRHYTDLRLTDAARGVDAMPDIGTPADRPEAPEARATGTDGADSVVAQVVAIGAPGGAPEGAAGHDAPDVVGRIGGGADAPKSRYHRPSGTGRRGETLACIGKGGNHEKALKTRAIGAVG